MLTIGEFSRLTFVPAKTLRYYDRIGLFKPMKIDKFTQYRYYSVEQLPRLYRILALKALGLSLEQISHLLEEDVSTEQMRGMLVLKRSELNQQMAEVQQRLAYVESKIQQLEAEGNMPKYDVILKNVEATRVVLARGIAPEFKTLGYTISNLFTEASDYLRQHGVRVTGHGITLYYDEEFRETQIQVGAAFQIDDDLNIPDSQDVVVTTLAAHTMASVVHHGAFTTLENAYNAVIEWIENNQYQIIGVSRELNLKFNPKGDPNDFVTEVQFPVTKRVI